MMLWDICVCVYLKCLIAGLGLKNWVDFTFIQVCKRENVVVEVLEYIAEEAAVCTPLSYIHCAIEDMCFEKFNFPQELMIGLTYL